MLDVLFSFKVQVWPIDLSYLNISFPYFITTVNIDDCDPNPCKNGGACTDGVNTYTCVCAAGYEGDDCDSKLSL